MTKKNQTAELILNIVLVIFTVIGIILMLTGKPVEGTLQSTGIENFKFYTVLTNVFCGDRPVELHARTVTMQGPFVVLTGTALKAAATLERLFPAPAPAGPRSSSSSPSCVPPVSARFLLVCAP